MSVSPSEYFKNLQKLIAYEKQEEWEQHHKSLAHSSTNDLINAGICWYPLYIEESGYGIGDYPFIIVKRTQHLEKAHRFDGGKSVGLFTNSPKHDKEEIKGNIFYCNAQSMKIVFQTNDLPDWIDDGKLGVKLLFDESSYREMDQAISKLCNEEAKGIPYVLRDILLNNKPNLELNKVDFIYKEKLNQSQNLAIKNILESNDVTIVHGPPGTGKTTTLVHAIKEILKESVQVLACAPSNAAADLLTERLAAEGIQVIRIGNLSRIDKEVYDQTLDQKLLKHSSYPRIKEFTQRAAEMRRMANKYKRNFGFDEREQRRLLLKEAKSLISEVNYLEDDIISDVITNAKVVISTLVGANHRYIRERSFDVVIIDEAAQALEPACWIPILKCKGKLVLTGDHKQLPPTIKSDKARAEGLAITLMEKAMAFLPNVNLLDTQYRMNSAIMSFPNQEFYNGKLIADKSVITNKLKILNDIPIEFIDTAGCGFEEKINPETQSFYNADEANILQKHLDSLAEDFIEAYQIGIISPYKEQIVFLNKFISISNGFAQLQINTIDSFQGRECDIVYISLVRSNNESQIGFLKDYRRMNVAMTRAKKKLVIIGDSATLGADPFYSRLIDFVQEKNFYRSAFELMYDS